MSKVIIFLPDNRKIVVKSGSVIADPQFLIINSTDGKYKFPWANVYGVFIEREDN